MPAAEPAAGALTGDVTGDVTGNSAGSATGKGGGSVAVGAAGNTVGQDTAVRKAAEKTGAEEVAPKKSTPQPMAGQTAAAVPAARPAGTPAEPDQLAVRPGEDPWTPEEVAVARTGLTDEAGRLRSEILAAEAAITGLMRDSGDGSGDDQADTGSKNITREHELALTGNAREMLSQTERALGRLEAGTYGLCETCSDPIGKARMQAFPRATLCVECKQRQERH